MFIRRIPYQSVERRRIHNWLLLLLRAGGDGAARRGVLAAVLQRSIRSRPRRAPTGAREVVILLDRSASMGYGDHWTRAQDEARKIVGDARRRGPRRRSCCSATGAEEAVRATSDRGAARGRDRRRPRCRRTRTRLRAGAAAGAEPAEPSDRCRARRPYLISDFQKIGLGAAGRDPPAGGRDAHADLGRRRSRPSNLAVTSVAFAARVVLRRRARDDHRRRSPIAARRRSTNAAGASSKSTAALVDTRDVSDRAECVRRR